jgi:hypothetical protein
MDKEGKTINEESIKTVPFFYYQNYTSKLDYHFKMTEQMELFKSQIETFSKFNNFKKFIFFLLILKVFIEITDMR